MSLTTGDTSLKRLLSILLWRYSACVVAPPSHTVGNFNYSVYCSMGCCHLLLHSTLFKQGMCYCHLQCISFVFRYYPHGSHVISTRIAILPIFTMCMMCGTSPVRLRYSSCAWFSSTLTWMPTTRAKILVRDTDRIIITMLWIKRHQSMSKFLKMSCLSITKRIGNENKNSVGFYYYEVCSFFCPLIWIHYNKPSQKLL